MAVLQELLNTCMISDAAILTSIQYVVTTLKNSQVLSMVSMPYLLVAHFGQNQGETVAPVFWKWVKRINKLLGSKEIQTR